MLTEPPLNGWPAQMMQLPAHWYTSVAVGGGLAFPVSGDRTTICQYPTPFPTPQLLFCQEVHSEFRAGRQ